MIKRMAGKIGSHLSPSKHQLNLDPPSASPHSPMITDSGRTNLDFRGSISTDVTAVSDHTNRGEYGEVKQPMAVKRVARAQGVYKLPDFMIIRTVGTGSFGRVHLVRSKHNLRHYAIKVLNKDKVVKSKQTLHTLNERNMLLSVQHAFLINLWGTFQDSANLYMVMDFVPGGELFTLLRRSNRFPEPVAKFYAAEVAVALNYLHSRDIVYRDLKPENILLAQDGHIKIADFGFAISCTSTVWTLCGTPDYLAPEIVLGNRYNKSVDWYALGVLVFEMLCGTPPYHDHEGNYVVLYEKIKQGPTCIRWPNISAVATDVILRLMEGDPSRRIGNLHAGAVDVFTHPWFTEVDWVKLSKREITAPYLPKLSHEGDASAFDNYPENDFTYGEESSDPYRDLFPDFEYTNLTTTS
ncbi:kinase-like domain-containing protein [Pterulicium gracile]|uniref:cAMP-dependent protein kinase n=1 Tax=Pterulicium gracile TaxID=1884261 RepID=A0A5C3QEV1_9AGAR|nr:kinase-like domain-containing protein [Pterula gracilis]